MRLEVNPFRMGTDKEAALKPLEEAAEVFGAWQTVDECEGREFMTCRLDMYPNVKQNDCQLYVDFAYEIADCITACVNLADRYGIDLQPALDAVEKHNRERGRYGSD